MNKDYKLINSKTKEETICNKVTLEDGFDYYINKTIKQEDLKNKDFLIWKDEIHQFHSDMGYGWKTYTNMEEDGSSLCLNYSNVVGLYITTNNPNIDISKVIDEVKTLSLEYTINKNTQFSTNLIK